MELDKSVKHPCSIKVFNTLETNYKKVHKDFYDYSKFVYKGSRYKSIIICKLHGEFEQTPSEHLRGSGCPTCGRIKGKITRGISIENFFSQIPIKLQKYTFVDLPDIINKKDKIKVVCPIHGVFIKQVDKFLKSEGCPRCVQILKGKNKAIPLKVWIEKAKHKHSNIYIYPEYISKYYSNGLSKVPIICKEHGEWFTSAKEHLKGSGCPKCNSFHRGYYIGKPTLFYIIKIDNLYKIGITTKSSVLKRYSGEYNLDEINIIFEYLFQEGEKAFNLELRLKEKYKAFKYEGESIFKFTGNSEIFTKNIYELEDWDTLLVGNQ